MATGSTRLVVFAGLPGCGKTTLARALADELGATFLRIDTFEAAIVSTLMPFEDNPVGYVAAAWVAEDQLLGGRTVVVDACNNLQAARSMWTDLALGSQVRLHWVEVICSDTVEHRRRVETREPDRPGQGNPTWAQVRARRWEPFTEPRILIDNTGAAASHVATIRSALRTD
ncbi:AAA family ATPase [Nocardia jinanensis]|uniref:Adenylyl-sulfate kinase n=1 Tax=Nocardia jinanensis TaxID=382504 RepID=A0A917S0R5_9NOCA|nr:ATP-binding protein [Nocardia jinanensis]GGL47347.1 adenylyl-sulfate kinase [Nocardia jinanensis]